MNDDDYLEVDKNMDLDMVLNLEENDVYIFCGGLSLE